jgi:hypothetical protein
MNPLSVIPPVHPCSGEPPDQPHLAQQAEPPLLFFYFFYVVLTYIGSRVGK